MWWILEVLSLDVCFPCEVNKVYQYYPKYPIHLTIKSVYNKYIFFWLKLIISALT